MVARRLWRGLRRAGWNDDQRLSVAGRQDRPPSSLTPPPITLAVVGADFSNKGKSPTRRFEIALCAPGDPVELIPEPKNPADENAVAVYSERGVQLGYLTAERAPLISKYMRDGHDIVAVFQAATSFGAYIRVAFDGDVPTLPELQRQDQQDDSGFWPDYVPPDD